MTLPTFLLLGAPKAGTTALYYVLQQHPQVFMSAVKEPHFFAFADAQAAQFNGPRDDRGELTTRSVTDVSAYKALFAGATEMARGEASTMYLYYPQVPERIAHYAPEMKLVAILRNPIDRAFSHFLHLRREGREGLTDFAQALAAEPERIAQGWSPAWHYQAVGNYTEQLPRYWQQFPRQQLRIYLYEDWQRDPAGFLCDLFEFIGVDSGFEAQLGDRANTTTQVQKNLGIHDFLTQENPLKSILRRLIPARIRQPLAAKAYRANVDAPPQLTPALRTQLLPQFREGILRTQELIGRDLSHWL
ncbi:MAG: sulfotransferase [Spirulina sp. SIO3F2]|nr:sulfotransferase [Spirulina sp. SIO3F2]